jgi:hypothetical protein
LWKLWTGEAAAMVAVLAVVAMWAPAPGYDTDRGTYEATGRQIIVPDCSSIHCFRPLVAWIVEQAPGPSLLKWKTYAVLANTAGGMAVMAFATAMGFAPRAARLAGWLSAVGFGSFFTLFDPHTSDPLMYAAGPVVATLLVRERFAAAGLTATVGIFAKEFAAAPLFIVSAAEAMARRWTVAFRVGAIAAAVTLVWLVLQLWLMLGFNYSYAGSASADLFGGGYIRVWASYVSPRVAAATILGEFGALFLLIPLGLWRSGADLRRMAIASVPAIIALAYVQQPDRALWNFHFIAVPLAVIVLDRLAWPWSVAFVVTYGMANLRLGAQVPWAPSARLGLAISSILGMVAIANDLRRRGGLAATVRARRNRASARIVRSLPGTRRVSGSVRPPHRVFVAALVIGYALAFTLVADVWAHRRSQDGYGVNVWGYRGPVARQTKVEDRRILVLGGSVAFGTGLTHAETVPAYLERNLNQKWRQGYASLVATVINLAGPGDAPASYAATLRDFEMPGTDVVCLLIDPQLQPAGSPDPWRHRSAIFRWSGYFPVLLSTRQGAAQAGAAWSDPVRGDRGQPVALCEGEAEPSCDAVESVVARVLESGHKVAVVQLPHVSAATNRSNVLADRLRQRFEARQVFRNIDLTTAAELTAVRDGGPLTAPEADRIADLLTTPMLELMR